MNWEPWTGCYKISDGCTNCYFYGPHAKRYGQNTIQKTDKFDWPIRKTAKGEYNIKGNKILATCFATDFFLPEADEWRKEIWSIIKERADIDLDCQHFLIQLLFDHIRKSIFNRCHII